MRIKSLAKGIARGYSAIDRTVFKREARSFREKVESGCVLTVLAWLFIFLPIVFVVVTISDSWESYRFNHLSAAQHLALAKVECGNGSRCLNTSEAAHHLSRVPTSAPEYGEAVKLQAAIDQQVANERETSIQEKEKSRMASWNNAQANFNGQAKDGFLCATSTDHETIVSFDNGMFWWRDDGRCEQRMQKRRDEEAQLKSYWPTTVRVNTDMDTFWLPDEERNCQTYPDTEGKVATVLCDSKAHANHNIPVKFWGGVDRNTVSDWNCRREKDLLADEFVCRAID